MKFKDRLKILRESKGLTKKEVAEGAGISPALITRYEKGERQPTADVLIRLAKFFDVSVDYLLGLVDNPQPWRNDLPEQVKKQLEELEKLKSRYEKLQQLLESALKELQGGDDH